MEGEEENEGKGQGAMLGWAVCLVDSEGWRCIGGTQYEYVVMRLEPMTWASGECLVSGLVIKLKILSTFDCTMALQHHCYT